MRLKSKAGGVNASAYLLSAFVLAFLARPAAADSTSVGVNLTTDRVAHDVSVPENTKVQISVAHSFDNGVILGGSTEYINTAFSDESAVHLEGTVGYRAWLGDVFSVTGSAGLGERIRTSGSGHTFPYYVFRIATDVRVTKDVTWNALSLRYRNAFDTDDDFLTPQVATGISYDLDDHRSISGAVQYEWKDRKPDTVGLDIGLKYRF
jgi:hypothetical protein